MSKAKKGPAKKAGKKGRGKAPPMRPSYMAARKKAAQKSEPAPATPKKAAKPRATPAPKQAALSLEDRVKWLLDKAARNGWGTPYDE